MAAKTKAQGKAENHKSKSVKPTPPKKAKSVKVPPAKKPRVKKPSQAEALAVLFHDTYERLAPKFGYDTRDDTKKFDPKTPNGKLMVAVAKEVMAQNKKPPAPKKPSVTQKDFEKWFMDQDRDHFLFLVKQWNEANLHIEIPALDGYDEWLNFFKAIPPTVIRQLASTGVDFIPTDGYTALARWHDIISHPGRIDKIHQAGLTGKPSKDTKTIVQLAQSNDRIGVLKAVRDEIATKLQKGAGARDTAALSREMTEIMTQIADYEKRQGPKKTTVLGKLLGDVDLRKRPAKNGGGSRNTSYKSRVTIKDVEG